MSESKIKTLEKDDYIESIGRRKRSVARVRISRATPSQSAAKGGFMINKKKLEEYFVRSRDKVVALEPLKKLSLDSQFRVSAWVRGGGITGQAESVRMGLARSLVVFDPLLKSRLKKEGYLIRDPREKERRKYGLKKARRAPQFSKR